MKSALGAHCDDFYISSQLSLKLDLSLERETVLHFFDRIRKEYPSMKRFRRRDDSALILEDSDPDVHDSQPKRWIRLEPGSMRFGYFAPPASALSRRFAQLILEQAPYHLTLTDLDVDYLEVVYGFDLEYTGNHDQLIAETLFSDHPLSAFTLADEAVHAIDCQPCLGIALTPTCDTQAYLELKSRTSTFEVRTGEYEEQVLSVYLTVRHYWGFDEPTELAQAYDRLSDLANDLATRRVVPLVVNPLALAIASRR